MMNNGLVIINETSNIAEEEPIVLWDSDWQLFKEEGKALAY